MQIFFLLSRVSWKGSSNHFQRSRSKGPWRVIINTLSPNEPGGHPRARKSRTFQFNNNFHSMFHVEIH